MEQVIVMIFWLGQSCFVIQADELTILTDPYEPQRMGYDVRQVEGIDLVTVTHEHGDHNYVALAAGKPLVIRGLAERGKEFNRVDQKVKNVHIYTVNSYHDDVQGAKRGKNAIVVFEIPSASGPLRVVHMGDFGEKRLDETRIKAIGSPDILLVPVGGHYTIGPAEADQLIADLRPKIVIPMHYKTAKTPRLPIQGVAPFLEGKKHIIRSGMVSGNRLAVTSSLLKRAEDAGEPLIVPLEFGPASRPKSR